MSSPAAPVVERSIAWLGRSRRLSKDYERQPTTSEAMVYLAGIRLYAVGSDCCRIALSSHGGLAACACVLPLPAKASPAIGKPDHIVTLEADRSWRMVERTRRRYGAQ
jgi:hypothetical protein